MEEGFKVPEFPLKPSTEEETPETPASTAKPEIPYKTPKWSGLLPPQTYSFEVLKNGVIVDTVKNLHEKPFWMLGRLPVGTTGVDITAAHPTTSRYHAVLQYKDPETMQEDEKEIEGGWFIYDLGEHNCN